MFINKIGTYNIDFCATKSQDVPRVQQQAKIQFEKEQNLSKKADSMSANPITAILYKLYRSYQFMSESDSDIIQSSAANLNRMA